MERRDTSPADFALNHPAGSLSKQLTLTAWDLNGAGREVISLLARDAIGSGWVEDSDVKGRLLGLVTDGDLRRALRDHSSSRWAELRAGELMAGDPITVTPGQLAVQAPEWMERNRRTPISVLPVVTPSQQMLGLLRLHDLVQAGLDDGSRHALVAPHGTGAGNGPGSSSSPACGRCSCWSSMRATCSPTVASGLIPPERSRNASTCATGLGLRLLQQSGLSLAFLGGATEERACQPGILHCLVGIKNKPAALAHLQAELSCTPEHTGLLRGMTSTTWPGPTTERCASWPSGPCRPKATGRRCTAPWSASSRDEPKHANL